jgi:hypothetical protein
MTHTVDRDSLAAALRDLFPFIERERWPFTLEQATDAILAALPSPEPTLDVERLARAIASAGIHVDVRDPLVRTEPCDSCARGVRVIAREYAALAATEEPK